MTITMIKPLIIYGLLLLFTLSFTFRTDPSFEQDLGRHLKLGQIIWQTKSIPKTNLFSYTYPDFPFINHHYLFEVISFLLNQNLGLTSLLVLKMILILATVLLTLLAVKKEHLLLLLPVGFLFLHIFRERIDYRPELFSFFFTALTVFILEKYTDTKSRLIYLLPLIQLIWVNMHIYFLMGIIIQGVYGLYFLLEKKWPQFKTLLAAGLLSTVILLVNPNTFLGVIYPLKIFGNYGYTIAENQTIFLLESINFKDQNFLFVKLALLVIFISIIYSIIKKRFSLKDTLLMLVGVVFALENIRSFPYLVLLFLPAVLNMLELPGNLSWPKIVSVLAGFLLLAESFLYLTGYYYLYLDLPFRPVLEFKESYKSGLDFMLSNNLPKPIFNNFDIGGYVIFRGYPDYKVFVDGRPESYPADSFQTVYIPMQERTEVFSQTQTKYQFKTVIFSHTDQTPWADEFLKSMTKNPDWKLVYLDDYLLIFVQKDDANLAEIDLNNLPVSNFTYQDYLSYFRIASFLYRSGYVQSSYSFAGKALQLDPNSPLVNSMMLALSSPLAKDSSQYYGHTSTWVFW